MANETTWWRPIISRFHSSTVQKITWQKGLGIFCVLGFLTVLFGIQSPHLFRVRLQQGHTSGLSPFAGSFPLNSSRHSIKDIQKRWNAWTTRGDEWHTSHMLHNQQDAQNWAGLQKLRSERSLGSLWWDENAEKYFMSKVDATQFPLDCSRAHWIARYEFNAGLLSTLHMFLLPLFFSLVRGHPVVLIANNQRNPAFAGCGEHHQNHTLGCYFNITNCRADSDQSRLEKILKMENHDPWRTSWEELLGEEESFFPPGGVTISRTLSYKEVCVASSIFTSYAQAEDYYQLKFWQDMGEHGKVGVLTGLRGNSTNRKCDGQLKAGRKRRLDMFIASLLSSWIMNRVHSDVKLLADKIMSRYDDSRGQPLWRPPVLAIHIRHGDKSHFEAAADVQWHSGFAHDHKIAADKTYLDKAYLGSLASHGAASTLAFMFNSWLKQKNVLFISWAIPWYCARHLAGFFMAYAVVTTLRNAYKNVPPFHCRGGKHEDPYFRRRGEYLPLTNFAEKVSAMEEQYGLKWQSILILSDSGTAREALMNLLLDQDDENNVNASSSFSSCGAAHGHPDKRCLMYDWTADDHRLEHYRKHTMVPPKLKRDIQLRFLASLYIVHKIADHAVVTYSSNVGRFMSELITARFRMANAEPNGPLATSLDYGWFWK